MPATSYLLPSGILLLALAFFVYRRYQIPPALQFLKGPREGGSFLFGHANAIRLAPDPGDLVEEWVGRYGSVFQARMVAGMRQVVVGDPKGIAHILSKDTTVYRRTPGFRKTVELLIGRGLLWADGGSHKRQRKELSPAFSNASIREVTTLLFDVAHRLKVVWDGILETSRTGEVIIDVQEFMNHLTLDMIGLAGFEHDFRSVEGKKSPVLDMLDSFNATQPTGFGLVLQMVTFFIPMFTSLPVGRQPMFNELSDVLKTILSKIFSATKGDMENADDVDKGSEKRSIIGTLVNGSATDSEEIMAQMKAILIAGYDPPSAMLTWAIIEMSRDSKIQTRLREEISQFGDGDPTWDQLTSGFPYLEAFSCELLRMYPSIFELIRLAAEDDVIPLANPIIDGRGQTIETIPIPKGTHLCIPIRYINRAEVFWGPTAKMFNPDRWIGDSLYSEHRLKEIQGFKHILSFGDGPRVCLGKGFALASFKVAMFVLIRHFNFEFPNGPETKIASHMSLLPRPKVEGEIGARVPVTVRRLD